MESALETQMLHLVGGSQLNLQVGKSYQEGLLGSNMMQHLRGS